MNPRRSPARRLVLPGGLLLLAALDKDYELANQGFEKFLARLAEDKAPAAVAELRDTTAIQQTLAGLGHEGALALPGVPAELHSIIRQGQGSSDGVMAGEIRLDDAFTEAALRDALRRGQYPVLHIASHFRRQPGNDASSFLLLGDGEHLSLTDMGVRLKGLFRCVNLMTLSACETGIGGAGNDGREVEGFGVLAQRNGARSVVASLWSVAGTSTSQFMRLFYRNLGQHPETKLDALRDAQLLLLNNTPAQHYSLGEASPARATANPAAPARRLPNRSVEALRPSLLLGPVLSHGQLALGRDVPQPSRNPFQPAHSLTSSVNPRPNE